MRCAARSASLLVWEGRTILEVAAQAGHGVDVCEMYYARILEGYDPARRTSAEAAILPPARPKDAPWTRSAVRARASERGRGA